MKKPRRWEQVAAWFAGMFKKHPQAALLADANYVRARIPRPCFTKALTPARRRDLREALLKMTQPQREIARRHGWDKALLRRTAIRYSPKTGLPVGGGKLRVRA